MHQSGLQDSVAHRRLGKLSRGMTPVLGYEVGWEPDQRGKAAGSAGLSKGLEAGVAMAPGPGKPQAVEFLKRRVEEREGIVGKGRGRPGGLSGNSGLSLLPLLCQGAGVSGLSSVWF